MNRWPIIFVLIGVLAAGVAYDRVAGTPPEVVASAESEEVVISPSIADPPRMDGAWYCPVGSSNPGGLADHEVNISNLSDEPAVANLSILTSDGPGPGQRIELAPQSTERITLSDNQVVAEAAAVVEIIGGRGAVGHTVTTAEGIAEGPCATHASSEWYFAAGRTTRDSKQYLALMNPFPQTAVFDIEFQALGRSREPARLQGAFVEPRSVRIVDVGEFVAREENLATKVTAKRGKLVVERLQILNGDLGPQGAALQLGVPTPAKSWIFTAGRVHSSGDDFLTIYNPYEFPTEEVEVVEENPEGPAKRNGAAGADVLEGDGDGEGGGDVVGDVPEEDREGFITVAIDLWPTNPTDLSNYSVVTIEREVRPGTFVTINLRDQADRFEFPLPYELGVNVRSLEDLPIVVERWQFAERADVDGLTSTPEEEEPEPDADGDEVADADGDEVVDPDADGADAEVEGADAEEPQELQAAEEVSDLPQPIADLGISTSRGNERLSTRWVVPWVTIQGDSTLIAVASPEEAAVEVRILVNGQFVGPIRATVPRGGRAIIPVEGASGGGAIEVTANTPVSVEATVVIKGESLDVVPAVPTVAQ